MLLEGRICAQGNALGEAESPGLAGADLEHEARTPAARDPPWREAVRDPHDAQIGVAEDDVEGHPHEEHVDRLLAEGQSLAGRQRTAAEQAARTAGETAREAHAVEELAPVVGGLDAMPGVHVPTLVRGGPSSTLGAVATGGSMDAEGTQQDPLRDAREAALRRIGELRQRSLGPSEPAGPDLRTLLARSERHVDELRRSASELAAILPTRVEAAVARALGDDEGGLGRRLDQVVDQTGRLASSVERVEGDLLSERMARVEDLEVLVELVSGGLTSLRADLRAMRRELIELQMVVGQPFHVTVARDQSAEAGADAPGVRVRASVEDATAAPRLQTDAS